MASQTGKQIISILILPNISRSKVNQLIEFGHLIEYNRKIIFLKNHTQNEMENLIPGSFLENRN